MHPHIHDAELENWHDFEIESRREITALLRGIGEKNQLIRMLLRGEADVCVTTILDASVDREQNQRIVGASNITFETTLDKIRILFSAEKVEQCFHDGNPALRIALPATLIRLQRREYYRMNTPLSNPVRVIVPLPAELGGGSHPFPLTDISCGGIAIMDNKLLLGDTIGKNYLDCRIDLPEIGTVATSLQIRNSIDLTLLNNKSNRRLGCAFVDIARPMLAQVQRYITKLERERNARVAGLG